jgi:hypothetical protein
MLTFYQYNCDITWIVNNQSAQDREKLQILAEKYKLFYGYSETSDLGRAKFSVMAYGYGGGHSKLDPTSDFAREARDIIPDMIVEFNNIIEPFKLI